MVQRTQLLMTLALLLSGRVAAAADAIPGAEQNGPIAIVGATVHPISGPAIKDAAVLFDAGRIVALGAKVELPEGTEKIDASGRHVFPGLFAAHTHLGLVEIGAIRATRDVSETGQINPNVRAEVAVNPDSELIPVTRSNGVLLALTAPDGGLLSGTSAVLQLDGWTWEDMTLRAATAMHVQWPAMAPTSAWWQEESRKEQLEERDKRLRLLREAFEDARTYLKAKNAAADDNEGGPAAVDVRWEAMIPVLERRVPLMVSADRIEQIRAAVAFANQQNVRLIILGGYDAPHCAELLKTHEVPVIVSGIHRLPLRRSDQYDAAYTLPERLRRAGVKYCIGGGQPFHRGNVRNLAYHAATAAAHGLSREEALRAITLYPAEILGVADRVGSLEKGKDATLIITDGDPLKTRTQVQSAFIQGRRVDLTDRHKQLWKKYQEKYRRQQD